MKLVSAFVVAAALALPAYAQREAVSADLSPEIAGQVFARTVAEICVPAVSGSSIADLSAVQEGKLRKTQDAETRKQAGAAADETVWDVMDGKGVVTVREKAGRCAVSVYGAPAKSTVDGATAALKSARGASGVSAVALADLKTRTMLEVGPRSVVAEVTGSEPGSPGHQSKFSVVTATVSRGQ